MMHTLPIRNPLAIAYNTGILAEYMGGSHVPAPQPVAPSRSYNTGFVPEYQGGSHVPDAAFGQAVAGSSELGTTPA